MQNELVGFEDCACILPDSSEPAIAFTDNPSEEIRAVYAQGETAAIALFEHLSVSHLLLLWS